MTEEKSPIKIKKIGHVVLTVSDIERSTKFWTDVMGFKFSDRNEGGMMFFRNTTDHHTVALVQATEKSELPKRGQVGFDHMALEVATVSELFKIRDFLKAKGVTIFTKDAAVPAAIRGSNSMIPTVTRSKSTRPWIKSAPTAAAARQTSGSAPRRWKKRLLILYPARNTTEVRQLQ